MKNTIKITLFILLYAAVAVAIVYFTSISGATPAGADTMFYLFRADDVYHSIRDEGILYPIWNASWYNGVQISRYWPPLCTYVLALCQAVCNGSPYLGYLLFVGLLYFVGAIIWLRIGYTHGRPYLGAFIGLIWGLLPHNIFQIYSEGVLVRSMIVAWLPAYVMAVYDYFHQDRKYSLAKMIIYMFLMVIAHVGYAGMVALVVALYMIIDKIVNKISFKKMLNVILAVGISMLISGIYLIPSLTGGIASIDMSQIMASYFAPLKYTLNPFLGWHTAMYRWNPDCLSAYFGVVLFTLCILGILFARKKAKPGFITAFITVCLSSSVAYPLLAIMPGGSMLWMLRFMSISICFTLMSFLFWDTARKPLIIIMCVLLVLESFQCWAIIPYHKNGETAEQRYDRLLSESLLGEGRDITVQRATIAEPLGSIDIDEVYLLAGYEYEENSIHYTQGQGAQSAITYTNIVQLNQSIEDKHYLYYFDRCLELGNDTVMMSIKKFDPEDDEDELKDITEAAERIGYKLYDENETERIYHMDVPGAFGIITEYGSIGIGKGNTNISLGFPSVKETEDPNINHYTVEELSKYKTVFLTGFTYDSKEKAEKMVKELSETGTRVIIFADGIPVDRTTGAQSFLDVSCQQITFNHGFPELTVGEGRFDPDLFPKEYSQWKTVYVNGLDNVTGTFQDGGKTVSFLGTKYNENIVFLGINMFFQYQLTNDETVGLILQDIFGISTEDIPDRKVVPLEVETSRDHIRIVSEYDNVNTTWAYHDIFVSDAPIYEDNHLMFVDKGETYITFKYPYFWPGLATSAAGIAGMVLLLMVDSKRRKKDLAREKAKEEVKEATV